MKIANSEQKQEVRCKKLDKTNGGRKNKTAIPMEVVIQPYVSVLDSRLHGNDGVLRTTYTEHGFSIEYAK